MIVYIGTYTWSGSQGIYVGELDPATGRLSIADAAAPMVHPSFLAVDPRRRRLYAVSQVHDFGGQPVGAVSAFALDPDSGSLTLLNSRSSGGAEPCHLSADPAGRFVLVANYAGGSVALLPLNADGSLAAATDVVSHEGFSVHPARQSGPHPHWIRMDPAGRYALCVDLGTDSLHVYEVVTAEGRLALRPHAQVTVKAGAGPRHLAFHPSGRFVYVINELDSTLSAWRFDAAGGRLSELQTLSTLPPGEGGPNFPADIHVHPLGRFLYGSNRGHDSIAIFTISPETGQMSLRDVVPAGGRNPRGFAIDPTGTCLVVAHQDANTVGTFMINALTGDLTPTGHPVPVPSPVCVVLCRPG